MKAKRLAAPVHLVSKIMNPNQLSCWQAAQIGTKQFGLAGFTVVYDMVTGTNTSGFGYDTVNKCGTVSEPAVWESFITTHKGAEKWRNKPFPHYEDLCTVFGKDRAQGDRVRDFIEMENDANIEEQSQQMEDGFDELNEVSHASPTTTNVQSEEVSSARTRKRKSRLDPIGKEITNAAALLGKELHEASTNLNQSLKAEVELQDKTSMVSAEISKIPLLSRMDKFKASRKIMRDRMDKFKASRKIMREPEAVLNLWNLEGEERETFVKLMLEE